MSKSQKKPTTPDAKQPTAKVIKGKEAAKPAKGAKSAKVEAKKSGRSGTKQATLLMLLKRSDGATVDEMAKATGWQNHSVLGAVSGVLKKRLGFTIASDKEERGRVYRIAGAR